MKLHFLKVKLYSRHIGKPPEQIEEDIRRPKYFSPSEAVEYGIIDKVQFKQMKSFSVEQLCGTQIVLALKCVQVLYNERGSEDRGVVSDLKKAQLIQVMELSLIKLYSGNVMAHHLLFQIISCIHVSDFRLVNIDYICFHGKCSNASSSGKHYPISFVCFS